LITSLSHFSIYFILFSSFIAIFNIITLYFCLFSIIAFLPHFLSYFRRADYYYISDYALFISLFHFASFAWLLRLDYLFSCLCYFFFFFFSHIFITLLSCIFLLSIFFIIFAFMRRLFREHFGRSIWCHWYFISFIHFDYATMLVVSLFLFCFLLSLRCCHCFHCLFLRQMRTCACWCWCCLLLYFHCWYYFSFILLLIHIYTFFYVLRCLFLLFISYATPCYVIIFLYIFRATRPASSSPSFHFWCWDAIVFFFSPCFRHHDISAHLLIFHISPPFDWYDYFDMMLMMMLWYFQRYLLIFFFADYLFSDAFFDIFMLLPFTLLYFDYFRCHFRCCRFHALAFFRFFIYFFISFVYAIIFCLFSDIDYFHYIITCRHLLIIFIAFIFFIYFAFDYADYAYDIYFILRLMPPLLPFSFLRHLISFIFIISLFIDISLSTFSTLYFAAFQIYAADWFLPLIFFRFLSSFILPPRPYFAFLRFRFLRFHCFSSFFSRHDYLFSIDIFTPFRWFLSWCFLLLHFDDYSSPFDYWYFLCLLFMLLSFRLIFLLIRLTRHDILFDTCHRMPEAPICHTVHHCLAMLRRHHTLSAFDAASAFATPYYYALEDVFTPCHAEFIALFIYMPLIFISPFLFIAWFISFIFSLLTFMPWYWYFIYCYWLYYIAESLWYYHADIISLILFWLFISCCFIIFAIFIIYFITLYLPPPFAFRRFWLLIITLICYFLYLFIFWHDIVYWWCHYALIIDYCWLLAIYFCRHAIYLFISSLIYYWYFIFIAIDAITPLIAVAPGWPFHFADIAISSSSFIIISLYFRRFHFLRYLLFDDFIYFIFAAIFLWCFAILLLFSFSDIIFTFAAFSAIDADYCCCHYCHIWWLLSAIIYCFHWYFHFIFDFILLSLFDYLYYLFLSLLYYYWLPLIYYYLLPFHILLRFSFIYYYFPAITLYYFHYYASTFFITDDISIFTPMAFIFFFHAISFFRCHFHCFRFLSFISPPRFALLFSLMPAMMLIDYAIIFFAAFFDYFVFSLIIFIAADFISFSLPLSFHWLFRYFHLFSFLYFSLFIWYYFHLLLFHLRFLMIFFISLSLFSAIDFLLRHYFYAFMIDYFIYILHLLIDFISIDALLLRRAISRCHLIILYLLPYAFHLYYIFIISFLFIYFHLLIFISLRHARYLLMPMMLPLMLRFHWFFRCLFIVIDWLFAVDISLLFLSLLYFLIYAIISILFIFHYFHLRHWSFIFTCIIYCLLFIILLLHFYCRFFFWCFHAALRFESFHDAMLYFAPLIDISFAPLFHIWRHFLILLLLFRWYLFSAYLFCFRHWFSCHCFAAYCLFYLIIDAIIYFIYLCLFHFWYYFFRHLFLRLRHFFLSLHCFDIIFSPFSSFSRWYFLHLFSFHWYFRHWCRCHYFLLFDIFYSFFHAILSFIFHLLSLLSYIYLFIYHFAIFILLLLIMPLFIFISCWCHYFIYFDVFLSSFLSIFIYDDCLIFYWLPFSLIDFWLRCLFRFISSSAIFDITPPIFFRHFRHLHYGWFIFAFIDYAVSLLHYSDAVIIIALLMPLFCLRCFIIKVSRFMPCWRLSYDDCAIFILRQEILMLPAISFLFWLPFITFLSSLRHWFHFYLFAIIAIDLFIFRLLPPFLSLIYFHYLY